MPGLATALRQRLDLPPHTQARRLARERERVGRRDLPGISADVFTGAPPEAVRPYADWPLKAGRVSWDLPFQILGNMRVLLPPDQTMDDWRTLNLDESTLEGVPAARLLTILADLSPDVSRAIWDFLRLCNPGFEVHCYRPGTKTPNRAAEKLVHTFLDQLGTRHGSVDVVMGRLFFSAFLRGAMFSELVLDEDLEPLDIATPDPVTVRFERVTDPLLGQIWIPGQFQGGNFVELINPTISYLPVDPAPGVPYGRAPAAPSIFASLFLVGLLHDVRRVVAQQGHLRLDLAVSLEELKKNLPPHIAANPVELRDWINNTITWLENTYRALQPDDAFVHTSDITVNKPVGTLNADAVGAIDGLIKPIERLLARSLKTTGLLMGLDAATSDATATRQWEVQVAGIKSVQHLGEAVWGRHLTLVCNAGGELADVELRYAELRVSELFRDEQTRGLLIDNALKLYFAGYIGQKEASNMTVGHDPDVAEPRDMPRAEVPYMAAGPQAGEPQNGPEAGGAPDNQEVGASNPAKDEPGQENGGGNGNGRSHQSWFKLRWRHHAADWPQHDNRNGHTRTSVKGRGQPLQFVPMDVLYDDGEKRMLLQEWDRQERDYEGLLDAAVEQPDQAERDARVAEYA